MRHAAAGGFRRRLPWCPVEPKEIEHLSKVGRMAADMFVGLDLGMKARLAEIAQQQTMLAGAKESLANLSPLIDKAAIAEAALLREPKPVEMPKVLSQGEIMRRALSGTNERLDAVGGRLDTLTQVVSQLADAAVSNSATLIQQGKAIRWLTLVLLVVTLVGLVLVPVLNAVL